jgi:hypothetical protein
VILGGFDITRCRFSSCNTFAARRFDSSRLLDVSNRLIEVAVKPRIGSIALGATPEGNPDNGVRWSGWSSP